MTAPLCRETAVTFSCRGEALVGILAQPAAGAPVADTAVLVIVGGPQYRAGSHRQFVLLSRALAAAGHPVLRFDYRGMGDSAGPRARFDAVSDDVAAAIDALLAAVQTQPAAARKVVLWGLCDGASAALLYLQQRPDPRVTGLCLLNPWVRSELSLARTHIKHYYTQRLLQRAFWAKLLTGGVALAAVSGLWASARMALSSATAAPAGAGLAQRAASYQEAMAHAWRGFPGRVLLLLSGDDYTAKEFIEFSAADRHWQGLLGRADVERHALAGADHTCSDRKSRLLVEHLTLSWLRAGARPSIAT